MEYYYILSTMVIVLQTNKQRGRKVKENSATYLSKPGKELKNLGILAHSPILMTTK